LKKIAILSDIHGNIPALEKVVEDLQQRQVDAVFNLGDHLSGPLWPKETAQFLMRQDWIHIKGNHDRELSRQDAHLLGASDEYAFQFLDQTELDWLRQMPSCHVVNDEFLLFHGIPADDNIYFMETVANGRTRLATRDELTQRLGEVRRKVILSGHTHTPRIATLSGDRLLVNPGSVGLPAFDYDVPEPHVVENGSPHARYAVLTAENGNWRVEIIAVPYDFKQAAAQAAKNDRPDWAIGLLTGTMQK
jgi:putative phosphoesterase